MSCEAFDDAIGDLVDGTIDPAARRSLDRHLASCAACREAVTDLRRIREAASALPPAQPPLTLWPRIASRLRAAGATERAPADRPAEPAPVRRRRWLGGLPTWILASPARVAALASAVVLTLVVGTAVLVFRPGAPGPGSGSGATSPGTAAAPAGTTEGQAQAAADLARTVGEELRLAEQHYEKAITGLEQLAKAGQGTLDPLLVETLQRNLSVIDQAITDSRAALEDQPTSELAQESLFEAFRRKVALLQDTIALINEMRKGNQAGAAEAMQKLNRS